MEEKLKKAVLDAITKTFDQLGETDFHGMRMALIAPGVNVDECINGGALLSWQPDWSQELVMVRIHEDIPGNSPIWFMASVLLGICRKFPEIGEHPLGNIDDYIENRKAYDHSEETDLLKSWGWPRTKYNQ